MSVQKNRSSLTLSRLTPIYTFLRDVRNIFWALLQNDLSALAPKFAIVIYILRLLIPKVSPGNFLSFFATSVEVKSHDLLFIPLVRWLSAHDEKRNFRHTIATTKPRYSLPFYKQDDEEKTEGDSEEEQNLFNENREFFWKAQKKRTNYTKIQYSPSKIGMHIFRHQGSLFVLNRELSQANSSFLDDESITIFGWNRNTLHDFLKQVRDSSLWQEDLVNVYRGSKDGNLFHWLLVSSQRTRPMETIVTPAKLKDDLCSQIEEFLSPSGKKWYERTGQPYRQGFLFYGPPGTGKSSMSFALAGKYALDLYIVSLNSPNIDEDGLSKLCRNLPSRCILLLEDVDTAGIRDESSGKAVRDDQTTSPLEQKGNGSGISLSALLNMIDGVEASEGRILIMTTNHRVKLDPALIRPGRVDTEFLFNYMDRDSIQELFRIFYSASISLNRSAQHETEDKHRSDLEVKFGDEIPSGKFTAAEIQNFLCGFKHDPEQAILKAKIWVEGRSII